MTTHQPQVGDVITTAEELDVLPIGAVVVAPNEEVPAGAVAYVKWSKGWRTDGIAWNCPADGIAAESSPTIAYLPGQPPRPERAVKAEALREAAGVLSRDLTEVERIAPLASTGAVQTVIEELRARADRIEAGEPR